MTTTKAFKVLAELSRRCLNAARGLPAQSEIVPSHSVLCFSVLGQDMAVSIDEVEELLEIPACTRLPRVKDWVRGVANVRGRLLPVVDFASYLGGRLVSAPAQQRILIIEQQGVFVGLIVDQVYGIRHFKSNTYDANTEKLSERIARYVEGIYREGSRKWHMFRPARIIQDSDFMEVAV